MPHFVADKVQNALNDAGKPVKGSHIHVMGVAYKRDIDDMRESPALDVMLLLQRRGGHVTYSDPARAALKLDGLPNSCAAGIGGRRRRLRGDHHRPRGLRLQGLVERAKLIVDTRNALKGISRRRSSGCRGRRRESGVEEVRMNGAASGRHGVSSLLLLLCILAHL